MSAFEKRLAKGAELQQELIDFLDANGVQYLLSGYEHLKGSDDAMRIIRRNNDGGSLFIRHYPDVSVIKPDRSVLIEVKNSTGIEKECYEAYKALRVGLGINVLLFLRNRKLCRIDDLIFQACDTFDRVAGFDVPVTEGVWKEPRKLPEDQYHALLSAYRSKGKNTSGCSFAFIDFRRTEFYELEAITYSLRAAA